ncbi:MAG: arsenate reductase (glutaredoxin) [Bacteroidetes bacterium]|nr:arsenate reductase (glutaredoxin) [Bacteroidota bacterium]
MATVKIYHNVRCSKSREACNIIADKGIKAEVVEYLKTPPTQKEIKELLGLLKLNAEDIIRKGEELYKTKYKGKTFTEAQWIKILAENPILIERPIIVNGKKAVIGRPPEKVLEIL